MITLRKATDRGPTDLGWLHSLHTFSFGGYHDPEHMGYGSMRVLNDDHIMGGGGFDTHPHENMEIITYIIDGTLAHKDSMGNASTIMAGEVQRMSAGTGVTHSEYNQSKTDEVHLLQIWFLPERLGIEPSYEQAYFDDTEKRGKFRLVASRDGRDGSISLNQDMDMSAALLNGTETASYAIRDKRHIWVQIAHGSISMNGIKLEAGDGAAIEDESALIFSSGHDAEVIVFDMASDE